MRFRKKNSKFHAPTQNEPPPKTHDTFDREFREFQRQIRKSHILLLRQSTKAKTSINADA